MAKAVTQAQAAAAVAERAMRAFHAEMEAAHAATRAARTWGAARPLQPLALPVSVAFSTRIVDPRRVLLIPLAHGTYVRANRPTTADAFRRALCIAFPPATALLAIPGVVIAGGFVGRIAMGSPHVSRASDVDLFLIAGDAAGALEAYRRCVAVLGAGDARRGNKVTTWEAHGRRVKVQIIHRRYDEIGDILYGFDLGSASAAVTGDWIPVATPAGAFAFRYGANILDLTAVRCSHMRRLQKYASRGFGIVAPQEYTIPQATADALEAAVASFDQYHYNGCDRVVWTRATNLVYDEVPVLIPYMEREQAPRIGEAAAAYPRRMTNEAAEYCWVPETVWRLMRDPGGPPAPCTVGLVDVGPLVAARYKERTIAWARANVAELWEMTTILGRTDACTARVVAMLGVAGTCRAAEYLIRGGDSRVPPPWLGDVVAERLAWLPDEFPLVFREPVDGTDLITNGVSDAAPPMTFVAWAASE
jgi:hypothetical protein